MVAVFFNLNASVPKQWRLLRPQQQKCQITESHLPVSSFSIYSCKCLLPLRLFAYVHPPHRLPLFLGQHDSTSYRPGIDTAVLFVVSLLDSVFPKGFFFFKEEKKKIFSISQCGRDLRHMGRGGLGLERDGGETPVPYFVPRPGQRRGSEMKAGDGGDDFELLTTTASTTACDHRCAQAVNLNPPVWVNKSHVHKGTHTAWQNKKTALA